MSDSKTKSITAVFEPRNTKTTQTPAYTASVWGLSEGVPRKRLETTVVENKAVEQSHSGYAGYYAVLTPSQSWYAISGMTQFTTDVTITMGVLLTVFHVK